MGRRSDTVRLMIAMGFASLSRFYTPGELPMRWRGARPLSRASLGKPLLRAQELRDYEASPAFARAMMLSQFTSSLVARSVLK